MSPTSPIRPRSAFVTLLTKPSYLPGVLVLHDSLVSNPVDSAYPLIVMVTPSVPPESREILRLRGIKIRPVEPMGPEPGKWSVAPSDSRFIDAWTKLRVFELSEFDRVVLLDADMLVRKNMDELMDLELPENWIAGAHACACNPRRLKHYPVDWIPENCAHTPMVHPICLSSPPQITSSSPRPYGLLNTGLVVCTPSAHLAAEVQHFLKTSPRIHEYAFADQDLISDFFTGRWKPLPYIYNALKTSRFTHPTMWRDEEVKCVHYVLDKPWMEPPSWKGEAADAVKVTHSWWWDAKDRLERRIKRDGCLDLLELVGPYLRITVG
ncbi:nucleotide-diphospho-sugar transferase [Ceratobasidium sp. AG-I]|nr:nucleotide-diphospho-sugar transferase [Ceratobasidium sp. AG-I]